MGKCIFVFLQIPDGDSSNGAEQEFYWRPPANVPDYMVNPDGSVKEGVKYLIHVSRNGDLSEGQTYVATKSPFALSHAQLEAGRIYFVGVAMDDGEGHASDVSHPVALEVRGK